MPLSLAPLPGVATWRPYSQVSGFPQAGFPIFLQKDDSLESACEIPEKIQKKQ
jgi:hypothetical protein